MFAFLVIFTSLAYISRIPVFNISSVEIIGTKIIDNQMIKEIIEKEIRGNYLWFFPKTNIVLYPKNNIKNELHSKFKRLKDISFSIKNKKVLQINLSEREAKYLWCETEEKCYFTDENGFIFDEAPYFSGEVYFKFYGLVQNFEKLISFKKTLEDLGLKPVALSVLENGDSKIFLSSKNSSGTGPEIIFKTDSDFQKIAENLEAALSTEPLQSNFKNKYSSLLYIDLRYGNKVYFKFRP